MPVERLTRAEKDEAQELLVAAFAGYPLMLHILEGSPAGVPGGLERLVSFFIDKRLARGWPILARRAGRRLAAVALVNEPGEAPPRTELARWRAELRDSIGRVPFSRLERYELESGRDVPAGPHHFLGMIGVHPDLQRQGHARPIFDALHRMAAEHPESTGVCLNTEVEGNVRLYEHVGYRVIGERDVGPIHTWCMFRANPGDDA